MRRLAAALLALLLVPTVVQAQTGTTGTVRTLPYLLQQEFEDGQPNYSITPQDMRDLIVSLGQGNVHTEVPYFMYGVPPNSAVLPYLFSITTTINATPGIVCNSLVAATASTTITLTHVVASTPTTVGTVVFAAGQTTCTSTFSSVVTFGANDLLEAVFPATADATLSGINITIPALQ